MKEDILEQLVEDWFVSKPGWFVKHNIKFTIIANRLSTIKNVDEIILLDQGKIVNNGTHEFLLLEEKLYLQLYMKQIISN